MDKKLKTLDEITDAELETMLDKAETEAKAEASKQLAGATPAPSELTPAS